MKFRPSLSTVRGGYSRSCAVATALHRLYGYHAELKNLVQANPSIVRVMMGDVLVRQKLS